MLTTPAPGPAFPPPPGPASSTTPCATCGKPRPAIAVAHADPFCSTLCARAHYGVEYPSDTPNVGRPAKGY